MCLDSVENVLQRETKKRENILQSEFSTEHILPFKNKNWIGSGDVPETAAEVILKVDGSENEEAAQWTEMQQFYEIKDVFYIRWELSILQH